jgi:hypothetical protein
MKKSELLSALQNEIQRHKSVHFYEQGKQERADRVVGMPEAFRHRGTPFHP